MSGCWDRREINQLGIVSTAAFDKEGDEVVVTVEIFQSELGEAGAAQGTVGSGRASLTAQGRGLTAASAIRDLARKVSRRVYWPHTQAVIVGEELAGEGLTEILDLWNREVELRRTAMMLIARGKAWDVVTGVHRGLESTISDEIAGLERSSRFNGYTTVSSIHDIIRSSEAGNGTALTGLIEIAEAEQPPTERSPVPGEAARALEPVKTKMIQLAGLAILKNGKLENICMASPLSRGLLIVNNRVTSTMVNIECPCDMDGLDEPGHYTAVKVTSVKAQIEIADAGTNPSAAIKVNIDMNLSGQQCDANITDPETIREIERRTAKVIETEILESVQQAKDVPCDPFGFAGAFHRKDPQAWNKVQDNWDNVFAGMKVQVKVEACLRQAGAVKGHSWRSLKAY